MINFRSDYFRRRMAAGLQDHQGDRSRLQGHPDARQPQHVRRGYSSHSELAIDDVFHWGGDFADMFIFDIYPYMMFDFRFGEPPNFPSRASARRTTAFAQMRGLTRAYGKELGFWVARTIPPGSRNVPVSRTGRPCTGRNAK